MIKEPPASFAITQHGEPPPCWPSDMLNAMTDPATTMCAPGSGLLAAAVPAGPWPRAGYAVTAKLPATIVNRAA